MEFSRVVSLGAMCQVGHQINRRFGSVSFNPLDWVGTSFTAAGDVFVDDGTELCSVNIKVRGDAALNLDYGLCYYHEFPRDDNRVPIITDRSLSVNRRKIRRKYLHLVKRLSDNKPTLFLRLLGHHDRMDLDYSTPDPRVLHHSEINLLAEKLTCRFPGLPFELALITMPQVTQLLDDESVDQRVNFHTIPLFSEWNGSDAEWDGIFDNYKISIHDIPHPDVTKEYLHP